MKNTAINKQTLKNYWNFATKYKILAFGLLLLTPLSIFTFRFLPPLFIANILRTISERSFIEGDLAASFGPDLVWYAATMFLGGIVLWRITVLFVWQLEMRVLQDIHNKIFAHLLSLDANFHANRFGGSIVSQTNKFAGGYVRMQDALVFQTIGTLVSIIFSVILLWSSSPLISLFLIVYSLIFSLAVTKITASIRELNAKEAKAVSRQTGTLADVVSNILAVKSFAARSREKLRYKKATDNVREIVRQTMWSSMKKDTAIASFTSVLSILTLLIAAISVVYYDADVAAVYLAVTYVGIINTNLWDFSQQTLRNINRALGDAQEMTEILQIKPAIKDPEKPQNAPITRGSISFENVTFAHAGSKDKKLFRNLNIRIKPGEKIGLVGHSGSGKTTLTKLLLRFMDIQSGEILVDSNPTTAVSQDHLRAHISYVPQEPLLFHRTLKENIAYGRHNASMQEIEAISKMAHAHDFITELPEGYDTLVGERGVKLSGGQRQRIAIARAMLKNAPIVVLDEATSALDSESELLIQDALWKLLSNKTAIVIAHRLSTIQKMDRILVMEQGEIIEEGTHRELIRQNGRYAELWAHQTGGFLSE